MRPYPLRRLEHFLTDPCISPVPPPSHRPHSLSFGSALTWHVGRTLIVLKLGCIHQAGGIGIGEPTNAGSLMHPSAEAIPQLP